MSLFSFLADFFYSCRIYYANERTRRYMRSYRERMRKGDPNLGGGKGWVNARRKRK